MGNQFQRNALRDGQLSCGVLWGMVLFPVLFNMYTKSLGPVIRKCWARCHQNADDTQLYFCYLSLRHGCESSRHVPSCGGALEDNEYTEINFW